MKTLYIDCGMGAAGDMLSAALLELVPNRSEVVKRLNSLGIPNVEYISEESVKCGITGTHMKVLVGGEEEGEHEHHNEHEHAHDHHNSHDRNHEHDHTRDHHEHSHHHDHEHSHDHDHAHDHHHDHHHDHDHSHSHEHHHSGMHDIEHIVNDLSIPENVKKDVMSVYSLIAEAESHVHGKPVDEIHFHEVGTMDAVADVTAVCLLMNELAPDEVVVSPVHVGSGSVRCAHGILPVPAPATANILRDVPIYGGDIKGELCTPTGAALLKYFATRFDSMPVMKPTAYGYGMGKKDFERANLVRVVIGESEGNTDDVIELACNIDDMTAEEIGFATEILLEEGACDVYTIPIGMKKSRPGTMIRVMCKEKDREKMLGLIFKHTTTIGVRESLMRRYVLDRKCETISTSFGEIRKKTSFGYGVSKEKYEYEDLARTAREQGISIDEVKSKL